MTQLETKKQYIKGQITSSVCVNSFVLDLELVYYKE